MEKDMKQVEQVVEKKEITQAEFDRVVKENAELRLQIEGVIKRYKKLSFLYNEAIEKILSAE